MRCPAGERPGGPGGGHVPAAVGGAARAGRGAGGGGRAAGRGAGRAAAPRRVAGPRGARAGAGRGRARRLVRGPHAQHQPLPVAARHRGASVGLRTSAPPSTFVFVATT